MANRLLHLTKSLISFLAIFSFLISLISLPSFRPSHVAMASDRSFTVALIGYKPIIVRLENNTAYAHFDGLDFQGGFVPVDDNFIFDLYAYTDNTTANLEFLYNSFQIMAPYRYALYKLENGIYKPVKSSQWHYVDIVRLKKEAVGHTLKTQSIEVKNWKNIFQNKRIYFLWNNAPYKYSPEAATSTDQYGPIKEPSFIGQTAMTDSIYEDGICTYPTTYDFNHILYVSRTQPFAVEVNEPMQTRQAGFALYVRRDDFIDKTRTLLNKNSCHKAFIGVNPSVQAYIDKISLKYWVSTKSDEHFSAFWSNKTDSKYLFNPSEENGGMMLSPALSIIGELLPVKPVSVAATLMSAVETYIGSGNVDIETYKDGYATEVDAHDSWLVSFHTEIPTIYPDTKSKSRWFDVSYELPAKHKNYSFVPLYVSFGDSPTSDYISKKILNVSGTMWLSVYIYYYKEPGKSVNFYLHFPIRIQLRYRLVK